MPGNSSGVPQYEQTSFFDLPNYNATRISPKKTNTPKRHNHKFPTEAGTQEDLIAVLEMGIWPNEEEKWVIATQRHKDILADILSNKKGNEAKLLDWMIKSKSGIWKLIGRNGSIDREFCKNHQDQKYVKDILSKFLNTLMSKRVEKFDMYVDIYGEELDRIFEYLGFQAINDKETETIKKACDKIWEGTKSYDRRENIVKRAGLRLSKTRSGFISYDILGRYDRDNKTKNPLLSIFASFVSSGSFKKGKKISNLLLRHRINRIVYKNTKKSPQVSPGGNFDFV